MGVFNCTLLNIPQALAIWQSPYGEYEGKGHASSYHTMPNRTTQVPTQWPVSVWGQRTRTGRGFKKHSTKTMILQMGQEVWAEHGIQRAVRKLTRHRQRCGKAYSEDRAKFSKTGTQYTHAWKTRGEAGAGDMAGQVGKYQRFKRHKTWDKEDLIKSKSLTGPWKIVSLPIPLYRTLSNCWPM